MNDQDAAQVEVRSVEGVEIVGPRGQGLMDRSVLGQWLARAGFTSQVLRWFCGTAGRVVVEQRAQCHDVTTGEAQDSSPIGSEFVVRGRRVVRYVRRDDGLLVNLGIRLGQLDGVPELTRRPELRLVLRRRGRRDPRRRLGLLQPLNAGRRPTPDALAGGSTWP